MLESIPSGSKLASHSCSTSCFLPEPIQTESEAKQELANGFGFFSHMFNILFPVVNKWEQNKEGNKIYLSIIQMFC